MAEIVAANDAGTPVEKQRKRSTQVWNNRAGWDSLYSEAYDYVLPNRRPGGLGKVKQPTQLIFDMTGPNSAMHCAGEIQRQMFPASTPFITETGPLVAQQLKASEKIAWDKKLQGIASFVYPFMKTGDYDDAMHEACTDLTLGTGVVLPLKGPSINEPVRFVCIPQDEVAIGQDAWGRVNYCSWKRQNLGREAVIEAWPKGEFTDDFRKAAADKPYDEITVFQDFYRLPDGRWRFCVYLERDGGFIAQETYATQPVAVMRFYRWPGEAYGRGPVLFALPTIKTVNKAQELTLKSAAIQLLGIWGFRAGGTFNPDTVRLGPGEFWPMQSTGGLLGPDVQRLDTATARFDVAKMVIGDGQRQIREALLDTRLFDDGGTPPSASEVALIQAQNAKVHIGAYGRLNTEGTGVIVPRVMEILNEWKILPQLMTFNQLLVSMYINSPMAAALKADELQAAVNYYRLVAETVGPQRVNEYISVDRYLDRTRNGLLVPIDIVTTPDEQKAAVEANAQREAEAIAAQAAIKAAPQLVDAATQPEAQAA
ncbi:portal protein [Mesorhizobium muleiense]|uniref:portal protein n=1 Tax=Mesorhizobium muleiense TaxID=1004279 RepID=UPI001F43495E|nr:portal protein [Mesorhizobium muleiense]MCF6120532.1 portal protein [Mesorhizobium muleiense]